MASVVAKLLYPLGAEHVGVAGLVFCGQEIPGYRKNREIRILDLF